ncbi:Interphotoreceptor matrix proteoglycan 2 [Liparis tanakae]|uniref:Interphotoreceptor matrix proteoglycan 2 n=1 Tax=Liparis tanakae TaxID=230148 RepID=A0A4Z2E9J7_9TELE|nr:Interphotoreceptor matrix proteoglycan 2 [Liparis tanakae]
MEQAVDDHLKYFHLRVCQETVWEAFKIFWDRLPERDQYQDWVRRCMDESVSAQDIGHFFSQSEEHYSLIRSRNNEVVLKFEVVTRGSCFLSMWFWFWFSESGHGSGEQQVSVYFMDLRRKHELRVS